MSVRLKLDTRKEPELSNREAKLRKKGMQWKEKKELKW